MNCNNRSFLSLVLGSYICIQLISLFFLLLGYPFRFIFLHLDVSLLLRAPHFGHLILIDFVLIQMSSWRATATRNPFRLLSKNGFLHPIDCQVYFSSLLHGDPLPNKIHGEWRNWLCLRQDSISSSCFCHPVACYPARAHWLEWILWVSTPRTHFNRILEILALELSLSSRFIESNFPLKARLATTTIYNAAVMLFILESLHNWIEIFAGVLAGCSNWVVLPSAVSYFIFFKHNRHGWEIIVDSDLTSLRVGAQSSRQHWLVLASKPQILYNFFV